MTDHQLKAVFDSLLDEIRDLQRDVIGHRPPRTNPKPPKPGTREDTFERLQKLSVAIRDLEFDLTQARRSKPDVQHTQ